VSGSFCTTHRKLLPRARFATRCVIIKEQDIYFFVSTVLSVNTRNPQSVCILNPAGDNHEIFPVILGGEMMASSVFKSSASVSLSSPSSASFGSTRFGRASSPRRGGGGRDEVQPTETVSHSIWGEVFRPLQCCSMGARLGRSEGDGRLVC
jgi:hypothetical protein